MKGLMALALAISVICAAGLGGLPSNGMSDLQGAMELTATGGQDAAALADSDGLELIQPKKHDLASDWDDSNVTKIILNGASATIDGVGASADGGVINISAAGSYVMSGVLADGQIVVSAGKDDRVHLILNGANITNKTGAAIYAPACDKLILTLADGTENSVTDGGSGFVYALADDEEPNAAIFSKNDLTINGAGALVVNAGFNNGIGTKDDLLIINGNFTINAANHGLRGNDSIGIVDGSFIIEAGGDGIRTNNETNENKGWIAIEGGMFEIVASQDGIQAENSVTIADGVFDIVAGGGSANAPTRTSGRWGGAGGGQIPQMGGGQVPPTGGRAPMEGRQPAINGQQPAGGQPGEARQLAAGGRAPAGDGRVPPTDGRTPPANGQEPSASGREPPVNGRVQQPQAPSDETDDESTSMKAIKARTYMDISGGEFTIDAADDAIHSNGDVYISGGAFAIQTGDDGIHADKAVEISGGSIDISVSYEGIEGLEVTISGGDISIIASDDGINASDPGSSHIFGGGRTQDDAQQSWQQGGAQSRPQWGQGQPGGGMGEPRFSATEGAFVRITGGNIDIVASNDGIDSNGHLYIEGGSLTINAQSMGADGAIEMDGDFIVKGGEFITAGSVYSATDGSTQPILRVSYSSQQAVGSVIELKNSAGTTLLEYESKMAFSASGFTSPSMKMGETYSVYINGEKRAEATISSLTTSIGENGGAYNVGRGGMGGGGQRFR
ncbi:MAG: carbohydrate-binding domain-containing protein [Oscillospiraceae bacterium]|nr:carbohydrate-binding domain-containing protein [Oscillospiraceae bacterium]